MKVYIDADASPVQQEVIDIAKQYSLPVILVKSFSHFSHTPLPSHVSVKYVDKGAEMADFKIIEMVDQGDVIITQDYGLASMLLGKKCYIIHHNGMQYTEKNMDRLLASRHANAQARRAGYRTKGPKAFTTADREKFASSFQRLLNHIVENNLS